MSVRVYGYVIGNVLGRYVESFLGRYMKRCMERCLEKILARTVARTAARTLAMTLVAVLIKFFQDDVWNERGSGVKLSLMSRAGSYEHGMFLLVQRSHGSMWSHLTSCL
jgi:hypothetical protein